MNTLSNVNIGSYSADTEGAGKFSNPFDGSSIIPEAKSSQTGVSVKYVAAPDKEWFVIRASYGRERKAADYMVDDGTFIYLPTHYVIKHEGGKKIREEEVLVPNILFVYATRAKADEYIRETAQLQYLTYYYDHFKNENGKNPPLVVPDKEMLNFVKATSTDSSHVRMVDPEKCHFKSGDTVMVTQGIFEGVKGRVARISGQQRVVVTIKGVCSVATAYVPSAFLESIN